MKKKERFDSITYQNEAYDRVELEERVLDERVDSGMLIIIDSNY